MKKSIKIKVDRDGNIRFTDDDESVDSFAFLLKDYAHDDYPCTCLLNEDGCSDCTCIDENDDNNEKSARDNEFFDFNSYDSGFRNGYISGLEEAKRNLKYKPYDLAIKEIDESIEGLK